MRVYISGPMTGVEAFNYPAFHAAAARFRAWGFEVLNPADNFNGATDLAYHKFMRADIEMLLQADAIALLPGWEQSRGAKYELLTAQMLDLHVLDARSADRLDTGEIVTLTKARYDELVECEHRMAGLEK